MEIKDKPDSMSVREWITKKIATGIMIPENIVRQVINHQFDSAHEALHSNNSVEISGFGKFYYNEKKADKEIKHCLSQKDACEKVIDSETATEKERHKAGKKLKIIKERMEYLINKKHGKE